MPNRNLKAIKDCGDRLCRDGLDEAGATRVATELVQHVSGMAETQPLRGKAFLRLFENGSVPRYSYQASVAVPKYFSKLLLSLLALRLRIGIKT